MSTAVAVEDGFRIFGFGAGASVALQGLTLTVEPAEIVAVLGPSGSGKTTLLRVIGGLERLSAGTTHVLGTDLSRLRGGALVRFRSEKLGFLDQHYTRALSPDMSIRNSVALQLMLRGSPAADVYWTVDGLLDRVGLLARRDARPRALSGGEQQRVAVCAAVAHRPRLLLVDEPAGELDAETALVIYELLSELARSARAAAVIVSHDPGAAAIVDRVVHVRDGRVVEQRQPGTEPAAVVSKGGWIRLPGATFDRRGMPGLVTLRELDGEIRVRPVEGNRASSPQNEIERDGGVRPERIASPVLAAELKGVSKSYDADGADRLVLDGLDLRVARGRLVAVLGRSGAGKTTLLHLLAGLERPTAGEIFVHGESLGNKMRDELAILRRRRIALVTQEPGLVPHLSARENLLLSLDLRGHDTAARSVDTVLGEVGLLHKRSQRVASLSAGERQRLAIARALAAGGLLLLADEPTARLDEENALAVGRLLARAAREHDVAVVCATHDPALVELADEVVQLEARDVPPARTIPTQAT